MTDTLILTEPTLEVFRHFESIASDGGSNYAGGIVVTVGDVLRVSNNWKRMLARAKVPQRFERPFAIYNVRRWLNGALAPFKVPKLTFGDGYMTITDADASEAGLSIRYPVCHRDSITTFDADPDIEVAFTFALAKDQLRMFLEIGGNLGLPNLVLAGTNGQLQLGAVDVAKPEDGRLGAKFPIAGKADRNFMLPFLASDFKKLKVDSYKVAITFHGDTDREGAAHLVSADASRHYWIVAQTPPSGPAAKK